MGMVLRYEKECIDTMGTRSIIYAFPLLSMPVAQKRNGAFSPRRTFISEQVYCVLRAQQMFSKFQKVPADNLSPSDDPPSLTRFPFTVYFPFQWLNGCGAIFNTVGV